MKNVLSICTVLAATLTMWSCGLRSKYAIIDGNWPSYGERYEDYGENPFVEVADQPQSTEKVDCDGASYTVMRHYVSLGQRPPTASVRVEEMLNYFAFDYPEPDADHNVSIDTETTSCPWAEDHLLMRIGLKGKTLTSWPPTNYVFLIDVSGSMDSADKIGVLKAGFKRLVDVLGPQDRVAIVTYAGSAGVVLPSTGCDNKAKIMAAIDGLMAAGSTAGAQGIVTAYQIAEANYIPDGNNRIILGTDGDFNVGPVSNEELVELIESRRDRGVYITVLGVGSGNLNDSMMEKIADSGNGAYEYIDCAEQIEKVFVNERSKFYAVAKDCKLQVSFNPWTVTSYRLIGYENRVMDGEEFDDDAKDAGDVGSGQCVTALYELIPSTGAMPDIYDASHFARLEVRYKKSSSGPSVLLSHDITSDPPSPIASASENTRFAASVAAFGMLLKDSRYSGTANRAMALSLGQGATTFDPFGYRAEYLKLVQKTPSIQ
jgi:Ca-activated chloride channel family protein